MDQEFLSNLIIKKIHSVSTIVTEAGATSIRKNRPFWSIIIKYEGETVYTSEGKNIRSNIENLVLLPKGSNYSWICTKRGSYSFIEFDADLTGDTVISLPTKKGEALLRRFKELERKWTLKHPLYEMECIKDAYSILIRLLSDSGRYFPSDKQEKIRPALDYMAENYASTISNDELAQMLGISTVYFRKLFTETMGISPINYIHSLRINKAKEILKSDYPKISVIAEMLGYSSVYHFSKMFKQYTGLSPAKYAKTENGL